MKRINVIGTTGSGKTTVSRALAKALDCPHVQMDQLFWKPNWEESSDDEFFAKLTESISGNTWVLDGNFSRSSHIKWQNADTIIWLDYSYFRTLLQLFSRTLSRATYKTELWKGTGNRESFRRSFMSKDSILIWFFKNHRSNKRRYMNLQNSTSIQHIEFIRLRTPQQVKKFIEGIKRTRLD